MSDINALLDLIPICGECRRVCIRQDWETKRPRATCQHCGRVQYYGADGRVVMVAKVKPILSRIEAHNGK